jgi:hypothetical protein
LGLKEGTSDMALIKASWVCGIYPFAGGEIKDE